MITVCNSTKLNCEIAGRTIPIPTDVWVGLVNLGLNVEALPDYMNTICTSGNLVIPPRKYYSSFFELLLFLVTNSITKLIFSKSTISYSTGSTSARWKGSSSSRVRQ